MCKIKTGKAIRTNKDIQNLITSLILRQRSDFNESGLITQTHDKMQDTEMEIKDEQVERMIVNTLEVLECSGVVDRKNGIYKNVIMIG